MPIWNGDTWNCSECGYVNAVLRKKCRNCGNRRGLQALIQPIKDEWDSHIRPEIRKLIERPTKITYEEYSALRMNSYEFESVYPRLDDRALVKVAKHILKNCQYDRSRPYRSYNEAFMDLFGPLLIERLDQARAQTPTKKGGV